MIMHRSIPLLLLVCLASGCFKSDVFDYDEKDNFLATDFYQNEFQNFELVIREVNTFNPIRESLFDTSYAYSVTYGMDESFYRALRAEWGEDIILSRIVNSSTGIRKNNLVENGRLFFTDTMGRVKLPSQITLQAELLISSSQAIMARLPVSRKVEITR